jgi:hypothetical protein
MATCPTCHLPLTRSGGFLKCQTCGFTYKPGQSTPLLSGYAPKPLIPKAATADMELQTFISRVAKKLMPVYKDYSPEVKKQLFANQNKIKQELNAVFEGKETLTKWFNRTRQNSSKHAIELTQILYDALEGLQSQEAKTMRAQWEQALQAIQAQYNPQAMLGAPPPT